MFGKHPAPVPADIQSLLEEERKLDRVPDAMRRRSLLRARRAVASSEVPLHSGVGAPLWPRIRRPLVWSAASLGVIGLALAAFEAPERTPTRLEPRAIASSKALSQEERILAPVPAPPAQPGLGNELKSPSAQPEAPRVIEAGEGRRAELVLVEATRRLVAARDYAGTLGLVGEHTRRFPRGVFVEERGAMRIKALWGLGREAQARSVVATFGSRFPRSALLPNLQRLVGVAP